MTRSRGRKTGWFSRLRTNAAAVLSGGVFAEGWGLPISGFVVTLLIAVASCLAFMHSAGIRPMTAFDWGVIGAAGAFFSQFGANCSLLRFNRIEWEEPNRIRKSYVFAAFLIFSAGSAYGIHHAQSVYRESSYIAERASRANEVEARTDARRPIEQRREAALASVAEASATLSQIASSTGVSADRTSSRAEAARAAIAAQNAIIAQADADLAALPRIEPLPEQRQWDEMDTALAIFCAALALLEFFIYSSLHPRKARPKIEPPVVAEIVQDAAPPSPALIEHEGDNVTTFRRTRGPRQQRRPAASGSSWQDARGLLDKR